jgi:hypothetical protein
VVGAKDIDMSPHVFGLPCVLQQTETMFVFSTEDSLMTKAIIMMFNTPMFGEFQMGNKDEASTTTTPVHFLLHA